MPLTGSTASFSDSLYRTRTEALRFLPLSDKDIARLAPILNNTLSRSCDFTVGGVFIWNDYFGYTAAVDADGTLYISGLTDDASQSRAFYMPLGSPLNSESINRVRAHCRAQGMEAIFSVVPEEYLPMFQALNPKSVTEQTDRADYIYRIADLAHLTGKAYNKKRNHVNRFTADNPDWKLLPLDADTLPMAIEYFEHLEIFSQKANMAMAEYDRRRTLDILRQYSTYGFEGAILMASPTRVAGFTAAEISGDTLIIHIEKPDHNIAGAGETINKAFAEMMMNRHPELEYVNREDDAGDPGLRYAKESYHPAFLLRKYKVVF